MKKKNSGAKIYLVYRSDERGNGCGCGGFVASDIEVIAAYKTKKSAEDRAEERTAEEIEKKKRKNSSWVEFRYWVDEVNMINI